MRFKDKDEFSKITLSDSYNKNYKFLFENAGDNHISNMFSSVPVFKYKDLIITFDKMPSKEEVKSEIEKFMTKININENYKVFSIKGNAANTSKGRKEYIVKVSFINYDLKNSKSK